MNHISEIHEINLPEPYIFRSKKNNKNFSNSDILIYDTLIENLIDEINIRFKKNNILLKVIINYEFDQYRNCNGIILSLIKIKNYNSQINNPILKNKIASSLIISLETLDRTAPYGYMQVSFLDSKYKNKGYMTFLLAIIIKIMKFTNFYYCFNIQNLTSIILLQKYYGYIGNNPKSIKKKLEDNEYKVKVLQLKYNINKKNPNNGTTESVRKRLYQNKDFIGKTDSNTVFVYIPYVDVNEPIAENLINNFINKVKTRKNENYF